MRKFNCYENTDETMFSVLWSAADQVIEMDTGTGAHQRRHAEVDEETKKRFGMRQMCCQFRNWWTSQKSSSPK